MVELVRVHRIEQLAELLVVRAARAGLSLSDNALRFARTHTGPRRVLAPELFRVALSHDLIGLRRTTRIQVVACLILADLASAHLGSHRLDVLATDLLDALLRRAVENRFREAHVGLFRNLAAQLLDLLLLAAQREEVVSNLALELLHRRVGRVAHAVEALVS